MAFTHPRINDDFPRAHFQPVLKVASDNRDENVIAKGAGQHAASRGDYRHAMAN
jgi:hypothetical protein